MCAVSNIKMFLDYKCHCAYSCSLKMIAAPVKANCLLRLAYKLNFLMWQEGKKKCRRSKEANEEILTTHMVFFTKRLEEENLCRQLQGCHVYEK